MATMTATTASKAKRTARAISAGLFDAQYSGQRRYRSSRWRTAQDRSNYEQARVKRAYALENIRDLLRFLAARNENIVHLRRVHPPLAADRNLRRSDPCDSGPKPSVDITHEKGVKFNAGHVDRWNIADDLGCRIAGLSGHHLH